MRHEPAPVTLSSSWRVYMAGIVSPVVLFAVATVGTVIADRLAVVPVILYVLGALIAMVSLFDTPRQTVLDAAGIHRRCLLRTHDIEWTTVDAIARAPALSRSRARDQGGNASERRVQGGLTAAVGRRRHLLADTAESSHDFDLLRRSLPTWAPDVFLRATPPNN